MDLRNTRTTILNQGERRGKREEIRQYFHATFSLDEQLYETLAAESAFYLRPEPLRHPLIFYLGHTATFYINKLIVAKITNQRINPRFESMFAVGVDEMSWDDLNAAHYDWPTVAEVRAYRDTVRGIVDEAIRTMPLTMPINWDNPFWVILMGIEHQRIHIETSSVIIRRLPIEMVRQLPLWGICPRRAAAAERTAAGRRRAGRPGQGEGPSALWLGQRVRPAGERSLGLRGQPLPGFQPGVSRLRRGSRLRARGLLDARGLEMGRIQQGQASLVLDRVADYGTSCPGYRLRTMAQIIDMPWDWPVEVNYLEAKAFCNWLARKTGKPLRLPTEAEWYRLRDLHDIPDQPYWQKAPGNINLEHWASPCPVNRFRLRGVLRHRRQRLAVDGDADHGLRRLPDPSLLRRLFHAHLRHAAQPDQGRLVDLDRQRGDPRQPLCLSPAFLPARGAALRGVGAAVGDAGGDVRDGRGRFAVLRGPLRQDLFRCSQFPRALRRGLFPIHARPPAAKALDLGCAVGRAAFELAKEFDRVTGIDFSARFIRIALQLKEKGNAHYELVEEGDVVSYHEARLSDWGWTAWPSAWSSSKATRRTSSRNSPATT